jgi:hypothetical protein
MQATYYCRFSRFLNDLIERGVSMDSNEIKIPDSVNGTDSMDNNDNKNLIHRQLKCPRNYTFLYIIIIALLAIQTTFIILASNQLNRENWEYYTVYSEAETGESGIYAAITGRTATINVLSESLLNWYGSQGWELVTINVMYINKEKGSFSYKDKEMAPKKVLYVFKRRI